MAPGVSGLATVPGDCAEPAKGDCRMGGEEVYEGIRGPGGGGVVLPKAGMGASCRLMEWRREEASG